MTLSLLLIVSMNSTSLPLDTLVTKSYSYPSSYSEAKVAIDQIDDKITIRHGLAT